MTPATDPQGWGRTNGLRIRQPCQAEAWRLFVWFRLFNVVPETTARFSRLDDQSRSRSPPCQGPTRRVYRRRALLGPLGRPRACPRGTARRRSGPRPPPAPRRRAARHLGGHLAGRHLGGEHRQLGTAGRRSRWPGSGTAAPGVRPPGLTVGARPAEAAAPLLDQERRRTGPYRDRRRRTPAGRRRPSASPDRPRQGHDIARPAGPPATRGRPRPPPSARDAIIKNPPTIASHSPSIPVTSRQASMPRRRRPARRRGTDRPGWRPAWPGTCRRSATTPRRAGSGRRRGGSRAAR